MLAAQVWHAGGRHPGASLLHGKDLAFGRQTRISTLMQPVSGQPTSKLCMGPVQAAGGLAFLVTGGTGALGTLAAAWLASKGAALLRLLGRTGRCTPCSESLSSLLCDGCTACVYLAR